jgi:hypothetical protein
LAKILKRSFLYLLLFLQGEGRRREFTVIDIVVHFYELFDLLFAELEFVQAEEAYILSKTKQLAILGLGKRHCNINYLNCGKIMIGTKPILTGCYKN